MIEARGLSVWLKGRPVLAGVDLAVRPGELWLVAGPSGSGKSTLALALAGLLGLKPGVRIEGQATVGGAAAASGAPGGAPGGRAAILLADPASQLFQTTVAGELQFGPRNLGLPEAEIRARVERAAALALVEHLLARRPAELSGGEKLRVALAAVLAMETPALILDEPFASLDAVSTRALAEALARLKAAGRAIVVLEHRHEPVLPLADGVLLLEAGRPVALGPPAEVMADDGRLERLGVRYARDYRGEAWADAIEPEPPGPELPVLARLRRVEAGYGRRPVLRGVDLDIRAGETLALVGENGSGKTTLARLVAGLLRPRSGRVEMAAGRGARIGLLLQEPARQLLFLTVREEVEFGLVNLGRREPGEPAGLLADHGLEALAERPVLSLSTGERQRTALASVLALRPRLVILDEPTRGQDWRHLAATLRRLRQVTGAGGAVLLISHDSKLVHRFADRVALLAEGRIERQGRLRREYR